MAQGLDLQKDATGATAGRGKFSGSGEKVRFLRKVAFFTYVLFWENFNPKMPVKGIFLLFAGLNG